MSTPRPPTIPWFGSPSGWVNVSTLRILDSLEKLKRPQQKSWIFFVASSTLRNFLGSNDEAMGPNWLRWMTHIQRDNFGFQFSESPLSCRKTVVLFLLEICRSGASHAKIRLMSPKRQEKHAHKSDIPKYCLFATGNSYLLGPTNVQGEVFGECTM